jgi:hypothetical protein
VPKKPAAAKLRAYVIVGGRRTEPERQCRFGANRATLVAQVDRHKKTTLIRQPGCRSKLYRPFLFYPPKYFRADIFLHLFMDKKIFV